MELAIIISVTALVLWASISWIKPKEAILEATQFPTNDTVTFLADYVWICMVSWSIITRQFLLSGWLAIVVVVVVACVAMFIWLIMSLGEYQTPSWGAIISFISAVMCSYTVMDMLYWRDYSLFLLIPVGVAIFGVVFGFRLYYNIITIRQYNINKEKGLIKKPDMEKFYRPTAISIFLDEIPKIEKHKNDSFFKILITVDDLIKLLHESSAGHDSISEHIEKTLEGLADSCVLKGRKFRKIGDRINKLNTSNSPALKDYRDMRTQLIEQIKDTREKLIDLQLKLDKVEFDKLSGGDFDTLSLEIKALVDGLTSTPGDGTFDDFELDEIAKKYE